MATGDGASEKTMGRLSVVSRLLLLPLKTDKKTGRREDVVVVHLEQIPWMAEASVVVAAMVVEDSLPRRHLRTCQPMEEDDRNHMEDNLLSHREEEGEEAPDGA